MSLINMQLDLMARFLLYVVTRVTHQPGQQKTDQVKGETDMKQTTKWISAFVVATSALLVGSTASAVII